MIAIYAPFIKPGYTLTQFFYMGLIAILIDGLWYISVAALLSQTSVLNSLQTKSGSINKIIGILLALYAAGLAFNVI